MQREPPQLRRRRSRRPAPGRATRADLVQVGEAGDRILVAPAGALPRALWASSVAEAAKLPHRRDRKAEEPERDQGAERQQPHHHRGRGPLRLPAEPADDPAVGSISDCTSRAVARAALRRAANPCRPEARSRMRISRGSTCRRSGDTACSASTAPRSACRVGVRDSRRPAAPAQSQARSRRSWPRP